MTGTSKYQMFHGRKVRTRTRARLHTPKTLVFLGRAHKIEYISNKIHGGGDGKEAIYVHKFTSPVNLYMDERSGKTLYLMGAKLKVTKAGIEN